MEVSEDTVWEIAQKITLNSNNYSRNTDHAAAVLYSFVRLSRVPACTNQTENLAFDNYANLVQDENNMTIWLISVC